MSKLTQEKLKELLHYDPNTGIFTWKIYRSSNAKKGEVAGSAHCCGYIQMSIDKKKYLAHRLVFLYMEGYFPENEVDHINRVRNDNRWCNLREISHICNLRNSSVQQNNTSNVTGINFHKHANKWRCEIGVKGKSIYLGIYSDFKDAVKARWDAEVKYNYPTCNTTSSAYEYLKEHNLLDDPLNK